MAFFACWLLLVNSCLAWPVTNGRNKTRNYTYTNRGEVSGLTMPDSTTEAWSYNGNGDTTAYTNGLSQVIYFAFDDAGRQTGIDYPTGTDVSFGYDNADRRTSMVDSTGTTSWTYDNDSRVTALSTPQGNLSYGYDNANRRTSMTDLTGTTSYSYDNASRMTSLTNPHSETTSWTYDDANRATRQTFSSGAYSDFGYDSRSRQTSVTHKNSSNSTISSESYVYDDAGNLTSKTVDSVTTTYGYDNADQLTSESRTGYSASYTYDGNGNRASKTLNGTTETYVNDDGDKLDYIHVGGTTVKDFSYDACGRTTSVVTSAGTTTLSYDYESRITQITYPNSSTNTFTYNGLDTRVGKVDSAGTHTYRRDGVDVTDPVLSDGSATYTPGISERLSGTTKHNASDRLGTFSRQLATNQSTAATRTYDAFGMLVSSTGTPTSPFGFAGGHGYQEDGDSGLKLLGHRYYDASTGRFLTRDPVKYGRNWATYCENNPLKYYDTNGHFPVIVAIAIVFVLTIDVADAPTGREPPGHIDQARRKLSEQKVEWIEDLLRRGKGGGRGNPNPGLGIKEGSKGGEGAGKPFPKKVKEDARREGGGICPYCLRPIEKGHIDHIIPKSKGGNNTLHNAQCTCAFCNLSKGVGDRPKNKPPLS